MEKPSFDAVYNQVAWELCVAAASKAKTELSFLFFADREAPFRTVPIPTFDAAAEQLAANRTGGVRIIGRWMAGGKQGTLDFVCDKSFSPTVTEVFIVRLLEEMVRMQIAKELFSRGSPTIESLEEDPDK